MKNLILFLTLIVSSYSYSQYVVDSVDIEQFSYDSSIVDNQIWQIGQTDKAFFDYEWVLVTDTTNMYNASIDASVDMLLTRPSNDYFGYAIKFHHKMDTDMEAAGGFFEINLDNDTMYYDYNGTTYATWWLKFKNNPEYDFYSDGGFGYQMISDSGHVITLSDLSPDINDWHEYSINIDGYHDTLTNDVIGYTGEYADWEFVNIEFMFTPGVKTQDIQDTLNFRFHFVSDATSSGKNGWAIKNIQTGWVGYGGLNSVEIENGQIQVYPNPTNDLAIVNLHNPENKSVSIEVYALNGRKIESFSKLGSQLTFDLSKYDSGTYIYKYFIESELLGYSKIIKE